MKVDVTKIDGYDAMTDAEKLDAVQGERLFPDLHHRCQQQRADDEAVDQHYRRRNAVFQQRYGKERTGSIGTCRESSGDETGDFVIDLHGEFPSGSYKTLFPKPEIEFYKMTRS